MSIVFTRGSQRFEIKRELSEGRPIYVGYVDNEQSVTGATGYIVARALIKKHIVGPLGAEILHFPTERMHPGANVSSRHGPDRAG